ncbi:benenodin family lasso peptide [Sphingobium sp. B2]|nr:benenodin family lasso peptide [Sphingobium sp. B2]
MQKIHDNEEMLVDLGVASTETQGSVQGAPDSIGLQQLDLGIADD